MMKESIIALISIVLIIAIVGGAIAYIIKSKKSGKRCIGCPYSAYCSAARYSSCCSQRQNRGSDSAESKENSKV